MSETETSTFDVQQLRRGLGSLLGREHRHVHTTGHDTSIGAEQDRARLGRLELADGLTERGIERLVIQIQWRRVERHDREAAVVLQPDRAAHAHRSACAAAAISSASPGPGTHGRRSGSPS